ncbi:MAG: serine hydrolase [Proteobacteria bacterium]|nr:serine hydrolase [Pseudomonadota bacterium]
MSDNTAANLLINRLGETQAVTAYVRGIGDDVTRLDRMEPDLNVFVPGDLRDTTSPAAMISTWEAMLLGSALTPESHAQLAAWMRLGGVTGGLIRASVPPDWTVADKSGGGQYYTRNLVAMITPPNRARLVCRHLRVGHRGKLDDERFRDQRDWCRNYRGAQEPQVDLDAAKR